MTKEKKMCCLCGVVITKPWPASSKLIPGGDVCSSCALAESGVPYYIGRPIRVRFQSFKDMIPVKRWDALMFNATLAIRKEHAATARRITANRRKEAVKKVNVGVFPIHQREEDDTRHAARMKGR